MKTLYLTFAALVAGALLLTPGLVRAQDSGDQGNPGDQTNTDDQGASFQTFYDQLNNQGTWIQTDNYGYVFQPAVTNPDWAPYTDGHWVYTDAGWTWVSDEPWGWATYHYGRWCNIDGTGWVWVPGYQWAPAWVSWRYGGGYAGWAPLPPESFVGAEYGSPGVSIGIGFHFGGDVDVNFGIGAGCYNFIGVGDFGRPNYNGYYAPRYNNYGIINRTTNITNITVNKTVNNYYGTAPANRFGRVNVGGPSFTEVNAHSQTPVQHVRLAESNQPGQSTVTGGSLAVYAPQVNPATMHTAKPMTVARTIEHPQLNRGESIAKPLQVTSTVKPPAPTPEQVQAAKVAQASIPAHSHIATTSTHVQPMAKPLTAMQPVIHTAAVKPEVKTPATTAEKPESVKPTENPAYTGEPKPEVKTPTEASPEKAAPTYHPQAQDNYAPPVHHEAAPAPTYHPAPAEVAPTEHHEVTPPAYHPEAAPVPHPQVAPAPHPQASAPAQKPAPGGGNGGGKDDKNKNQR